MKRIRRKLAQWFPWLSAQHPLVARDLARANAIPDFFRRLTEVRSILGYAALIHLVLFVIAMLTYTYLPSLFAGWLAPFLTPFGMPLSAGFLHTILYWGMLIGICNLTTANVASDLRSRTWELLRLTPYSTGEIILAKLSAGRYLWRSVLLTLIVTRLIASISVPIAHSLETRRGSPLDYVQVMLFVIQPLVDVVMVSGLSALSAAVTRDQTWARALAYGLTGLTLGGLGAFGSVWLVFTSPLGPMAGILGPLSHWSMLAVALTPMPNPTMTLIQLGMMSAVNILLPLLIGYFALRWTLKLTTR